MLMAWIGWPWLAQRGTHRAGAGFPMQGGDRCHRGELEIAGINEHFLDRGDLNVTDPLRGTARFDTGTFHGPLDASKLVAVVEPEQGYKIDCWQFVPPARSTTGRAVRSWRFGYRDRLAPRLRVSWLRPARPASQVSPRA